MDDRYPSTDDHQSVHLDYPYPDAARDVRVAGYALVLITDQYPPFRLAP